MTHVITSLCLRDEGCSQVCPVECIQPGDPKAGWPTYYIDPATCIDCGACVPECPYRAIFPMDEVPSAFSAQGGEVLNMPGLSARYDGANHRGQPVLLLTTRILGVGETVDLRPDIQRNAAFYK